MRVKPMSISQRLDSDLQASSDTGNTGDTAATQDTANPKVYGTVDCTGTAMPFCMGRRPMGHIEHQSSNQDLGNHFANCAYLEAASIDAFIELAEQLRSWGAPEELIQRCLVAAEEERNHTMLMDILAKKYDGHRPEPSAEPQSNTTLFEVALHNAVEGCVQRAWAACVATHQSVHADESLQSIFAQIANDEIKHAQLSWDLHKWFCTQLSERSVAKWKLPNSMPFDNFNIIHQQVIPMLHSWFVYARTRQDTQTKICRAIGRINQRSQFLHSEGFIFSGK